MSAAHLIVASTLAGLAVGLFVGFAIGLVTPTKNK